jgi:CRISPR-associated protein Csm4
MHSGTLFGHLCWAWSHLRSPEDLSQWLTGLHADPFLVSDAFPSGFLPRPLLLPRRQTRTGKLDSQAVQDLDRQKKLRKLEWLSIESFLTVARKVSPKTLSQFNAQPETPKEHRVAHNTINRLTGTTPKEGGLYFADEFWPRPAGSQWDVYVRTSLPAEWLTKLFQTVGELGFGRDSTLGRGRFSARVEPAPSALFHASGRRRMSLSHGSLTSNMQQPRYRLHTHYGRAWGLNALSGSHSPFKRPLTLLRPGSTFEPSDDGPYGELFAGVHPGRPEIVHNAWHLTVPFDEEE